MFPVLKDAYVHDDAAADAFVEARFWPRLVPRLR